MSIDTTRENVLSLTEAAKTLPRRRGGKPCHVSTLYRWSDVGCRGVTLETVQIGGTRCTSTEALQRFFERLTKLSEGGGPRDEREEAAPSPRERRQAAERADKELARAGW